MQTIAIPDFDTLALATIVCDNNDSRPTELNGESRRTSYSRLRACSEATRRERRDYEKGVETKCHY